MSKGKIDEQVRQAKAAFEESVAKADLRQLINILLETYEEKLELTLPWDYHTVEEVEQERAANEREIGLYRTRLAELDGEGIA